MTAGSSPRARVLTLAALVNLGGALLTFLYFHDVDPVATHGASVGVGEVAFFVLGFSALFGAGRLVTVRWMRPVMSWAAAPLHSAHAATARRRILLAPAFVALLTFAGWAAAGLLWGVAWPLIAGRFDLADSLRQMFGIALVSGTFVAAGMFLGTERIWRDEFPRYFPAGDLSAAQVPKLRVRTRMLVVLLLVSLLPLAVLAVAALTRANMMLAADRETAAEIVRNLVVVIGVLLAGGVAVSIVLASLVAASVARPLDAVQQAMARVRDGALDVRCDVISNDEIGAVTEGFNSMVEGLRERERIRDTFGKYVSPEVRDEILTGRAAAAGALREVTILFADLRDFTPWVEAAPAAEVVADLNAYFSEMDAAIRAHGGLVLQFIGDEIEAVFGAPLEDAAHADAAVIAAREMRDRLGRWNAARRSAGKRELRHGIGIHSGTVVTGNIGSAERLSYALVGDTVNVASRIQALNKELGTTVLVSGATCERLRSSHGLQPMPAMKVKGRSAEVTVYAMA